MGVGYGQKITLSFGCALVDTLTDFRCGTLAT